ncbi:MAG: tyrosine-type recombinase/integrase [Maricaulaceae bacterium]
MSSFESIQRNLKFWLEYHGEATLEEAADLRQQELFREWLQSEKSLGLNSVRKVITIGKAAFNWSYKRGEVDKVPYFELVKVPKPEPMGRHIEVSEVAALIRAADKKHIKLFILMLIATAARPKAVLDLQFDQIDFGEDIIDLNPKGRSRTTKTRPVVKLPQSLKVLLQAEQLEGTNPYLIHYKDAPIKSTRSAWQNLRTAADLDDKVVPYSIRRTMARFMRKQGVPAWEVAEQLGHMSTGYRITELYTAHSPDYLEKAVEAIDVFLGLLACELRVNDLVEILEPLK